MGQTLARDLGLQQSEEEFEKNERIKRMVNEMVKKKTNTNQSVQRSRFMSENIDEEDEEEEIDDEDDEEDEDEFSIDDSNYQQQKKGVISSDSSMRQEDNQQNQNDIKADPNSQYQRPFQSIQINKLFNNQDEEDQEEEHEQDMLKDISDDEEIEGYENQNPKTLSKQNSHEKHKKNFHNINNNDQNHNPSNRNTANENPNQIKFQSVFNKDFDFNLQSESEQSQFGAVFSSDSEHEQSAPSEKIRSGLLDVHDKEKPKAEEEDSKLKSPIVINRDKSNRGTSAKSKNLQSSKNNGKSSSPNVFFPSSQRNTKQGTDSVKKDYDKYLTEFFPDRKSQRTEM